MGGESWKVDNHEGITIKRSEEIVTKTEKERRKDETAEA